MPHPLAAIVLTLALAAGRAPAQAQGTQAQSAQTQAAQTQGAPVTLELNKLEPAGSACRAYIVIGNRTSEPIRELRVEAYVFDRQQTIQRRLALLFQDVRPERTKVGLFDFPDMPCPEISRILINDVLACTGASGPAKECALQASTRAQGVEFVY